jgi:hypothetical protein
VAQDSSKKRIIRRKSSKVASSANSSLDVISTKEENTKVSIYNPPENLLD